MITGLHSVGGIVVHDANLAAAVGFASHVSQQVELNNEVRARAQVASVYEDQVSIVSRAPTIAFGTTQIETAINLLAGKGRCIKDDTGKPGLDAYLVPHDECSERNLTDATQYRVAQGYMSPQSLTANHREIASLSGQIVASSKQGNEPLVEQEGVTLPVASLVDNESFTLYRSRVAGITLKGLKGLQIEYGVEVTVESADGSVFPEWLSVGSIVTRITLTANNPRWLGASSTQFPKGGRPFTHADTTLQLIRCVETDAGAYVDIAESEHITFTGAGLAVPTTVANTGDARSPATNALMLYLVHDGTNVPLISATNQALTDFT